MTLNDKDLAALKHMLEEQGRWIIFVHQGHVVKVAKVGKERPIDELVKLTPSNPLCSPSGAAKIVL